MTHIDAVRAPSRTVEQLDAARAGDITPQMRAAARKEGRSPEEIRVGVASGSIAIPANIHHAALSPEGVGEGLRTKVNVNLGISGDLVDEAEEWRCVAWGEMFDLAIDPVCARSYYESAPPSAGGTCTMCGKMCAMETVNDIMGGLAVSLD